MENTLNQNSINVLFLEVGSIILSSVCPHFLIVSPHHDRMIQAQFSEKQNARSARYAQHWNTRGMVSLATVST